MLAALVEIISFSSIGRVGEYGAHLFMIANVRFKFNVFCGIKIVLMQLIDSKGIRVIHH